MSIDSEEMKRLSRQYGEKLKQNLGVEKKENIESVEYKQFKKSFEDKKESFYEKACNFSEKILPLKPDEKEKDALKESIKIAHLNITPKGATAFSILGPIMMILTVIVFFFMIPLIFFGTISMFVVAISLLLALIMIIPLKKVSHVMANNWRLKASNQMVLCIFYIVTYMRHTSNLELALNFAAERLTPPLSYDIQKVLWDVETEKHSSIKNSLEAYLNTWKKWNMEFIESMHLIESSLYEGSEEKRIEALDKSLDVILDETYEKMLHYSHNLQSPLTMLHMMGIVLPILGLVILPLAVSFMEGVAWYHIAFLYNLLIPFGVYYLGSSILATRPTGYGDSDISQNEKYKKYSNIVIKLGNKEILLTPAIFSVIIMLVLVIIGLSPLLIKAFVPAEELLAEEELFGMPGFKFFGYRDDGAGGLSGPFGIGAGVLSLFIVIGLGVGLGSYYKMRSKNVILIRDRTKKLEKEFASALFQLGNRLGDGIPVEIAFSKVATVMEGSLSGNFFRMTSLNISRLGMSVEDAIFNKKSGSLTKYPSPMIESGMKVLTESVRKGPRIAANAMVNVSKYIKEIHRVDERLKDLMSDIISGMKSQISFLTPAIAGIVIGITSMITSILGSLKDQMTSLKETGAAAEAAGGGLDLIGFFNEGIPSFYFQIIVGLYVVQLVYILTELVNGIENGSDKLQERYLKGENLVRSTLLYSFIALVIMIIFNIVAGSIVSQLGT